MIKRTKNNKTSREKWIFLSWSYSRRSEDIAEVIGIKYIFFPLNQKIRFLQFPLLFIKTILFLKRESPNVIFIQHPPIHSIFPVFLYALIYKKKYIIDSHITPGTTLIEKPHHHIYLILHRFYSYFAAVTLFHSKAILEKLHKWRCHSMVFENPVKFLKTMPPFIIKKRPAIGMVSSFSPDEHVEDVIKAAGGITNFYLYITGEREKLSSNLLKNIPQNVTFTGFIAGERYYAFLKALDIVIVLTDRKESALLGAYETLSAETPLIVSNTKTMKYYFPIGTVFVENNADSIRNGIKTAYNKRKALKSEINKLKLNKIKKQEKKIQKIMELVNL